MAQKKFKQLFSRDYGGIDGESSAIEDDAGKATRAVNVEFAVSNSLRGRTGCQNSGGKFFGVFPYSYTRTQTEYKTVYQTPSGVFPNQTGSLSTTAKLPDGATVNKLVGINQQAWVLDTFDVTITNVSATHPISHYAKNSEPDINFVIADATGDLLDTSLGDGINTQTSIYSLLGTIDALAQFSVSRTTRGTCPPYAIINGAQNATAVGTVGWASTYSVTVTAHNFFPGDIICFPTCQVTTAKGINAGTMAAGMVVATTATTITYGGPRVFNLTNGRVLGYMGQPAAAFPISTAVVTSSGNITISFPYWRFIPGVDNTFSGFFNQAWTTALDRQTSTSDTYKYRLPNSVSSEGNLFIARSARDYGLGVPQEQSCLVKTDGVSVMRSGCPDTLFLGVPAAGGVLTGTYRYKVFCIKYDAQGNVIEGTSLFFYGDYGNQLTTFTLAANCLDITITANSPFDGGAYFIGAAGSGFLSRNGYKQTTQNTNAFFYVDDQTGGVGNTAFLQPGDPVCFLDDTNLKATATPNSGLWQGGGFVTPLGAMHKGAITDYCAAGAGYSPTTSSIKVSIPAINISAESPITTGLTVKVYRTTAGGNLFYELCEIPMANGTASFRDNVEDSVLIQQATLEEPEIGKENNPAPNDVSLVCEHQGGLVLAGGLSAPNTCYYSSSWQVESFPIASNSFDIPSTQSGSITAIASDTNDRLAVFKARGYYDISGDLDGGIFSVNKKNEGDYGVSSHNSLVRIKDALIGVCQNGYVVISDGTLSGTLYKDLNARLINQDYYFNLATAVNDSFGRRYICSIPTTTIGSPIIHVIDYSRDRVVTFEQAYVSDCNPGAGFAMKDDTLYHLSETSGVVLRRLERFIGNSPTGDDSESFWDNAAAISYIYESNVINNSEPDVLNTPIRLRVWSIPNDYVQDGWVPFDLTVETGSSPRAIHIGGTNPGATTDVLSFATENDIFLDLKLSQIKTHFFIVRFSLNNAKSAPFITGFEVLYAESYDPEDLIK